MKTRPHYVSAYDTEAIFPWWEQSSPPRSYLEMISYEGESLRECVEGIRAVAEQHLAHDAPATFFLVAKLVESAPRELREILDHRLFDIQSHTYTHADLYQIAGNAGELARELRDSRTFLEDTFGRAVTGLTTPGAFSDGLRNRQELLAAVWDAGYRYVRSVGRGPGHTVPAPLTQPFWYEEDGYPDLLELAIHGWHDNILTGQPESVHWPPILPWGYPSRMPVTPDEVYAAYAPGIDYIAKHNLETYIPGFHPWSIYRVDRAAAYIGKLLEHAKRTVTVASCTQVYEQVSRARVPAVVRLG